MNNQETTTDKPGDAACFQDPNPPIHFPTQEEHDAVIADFMAGQKQRNIERRAAFHLAVPSLERLCKVMCQRSGQPYKVRALLYSLYNGQPASLLEVVGLDWAIRKDLCAVILAFGFEEPGVAGSNRIEFFYTALKTAIVAVGQWDWFCAAHEAKEGN